ncbi:MAG: hypothetical protein M1825_002848 [Sarcosagium campestre]|nr:MAG: hypothetical protein M1825_002848 [Sarcosagium campestre]
MESESTSTDIPDLRPSPHRLSIPLSLRLPLATAFCCVGGILVGSTKASRDAGLRFRAENAHRLPTTQTGWYLYHKSKNYHRALAGVKGGVGLGLRICLPVAGFFVVEEAVDHLRGGGDRKDFGSSVVAALAAAGGWSLWNRFTVPEAARTAKMSLVVGLAYGLAQDAIGSLRGRRLHYVDTLTGRRNASGSVDDHLRREIS